MNHNVSGSPKKPHQLSISDGIRAALALLRRARDCADDVEADPWDFGLEIGQLYAVGLTITDLRWMVARGFVAHADETSAHGAAHRSFAPSRGLTFLPTTCIILTHEGRVLAAAEAAAPRDDIAGTNGHSAAEAVPRPHWDAARHELSLGNRMVKRFQVPAKNQEVILATFQKNDWPRSIADPLVDEFDVDPKIRLNDVVYRLNHKQHARLIRFHVTGRGNGVCWSLHAAATALPHAGAQASLLHAAPLASFDPFNPS
jgi:hypothetical protein